MLVPHPPCKNDLFFPNSADSPRNDAYKPAL